MRYGQARHKPNGEWVQTTFTESVVGIQYRKADALAFARAVQSAERSNLPYGIELEHRPDNAHDSNAIAVIGFAERKAWFKSTVGRWHIGYLGRETAAEIIEDLVPKGISVAGELYSVYEGEDDFLDFKIIVLAPPGHGMKVRLRSREATRQ